MKPLNRHHFERAAGIGLLLLAGTWLVAWICKPFAAVLVPEALRPARLDWYFSLPNPPALILSSATPGSSYWPLFLGIAGVIGGALLEMRANSKLKKQEII